MIIKLRVQGENRRKKAALMMAILLLSMISAVGCGKDESTTILPEMVRNVHNSIQLLKATGHDEAYTPISQLSWEDVNEKGMSRLDGKGYWEDIPGVDFGLCTGYVSWAAKYYLGVKDYPAKASSIDNRNGGEYVSAQRLWLMENAYFVGSATTEDGEIVYHGGKYKPGDIVVFNYKADGSEGRLIETELYDYWGSDHHEYFTHIGIIGSDNTNWVETLDSENLIATAEANGTLPEGMYNMHHNVESYGGICNILSPEQFITRDVPDYDTDFSRSYEIYRVLSP